MIHLTGHNYNAREFIQNIFSPLVGVCCSPIANDVCQRNNLSFVELLQPFAKIPSDAQFRDISGTSVSVRGLRLNFCDVDWRPPQTVLARKMLNESVSNASNEKTKFVNIGNMDLELPTAEPWFDYWRETFLTVQFPADHEFTRNLLSCLIVLSSGDPQIVETAHKQTQRIQQMQSMTPQKLPKWFQQNDVLNSYVVLHEGCQGDISKAQQGYEMLKSTFGENKCFLIQINSLDGVAANEVPDYWAPYVKRSPAADSAQGEQLSASKTPQDGISVISMPSMQMSATLDSNAAATGTGTSEVDATILHPLSPAQDHGTDAIYSKFSISSDSLTSQTINPNVWASESDVDAPHGSCLNAMDVENLRHFVQDYSVRALIPYVEHLVVSLNEAITNKKGVSKSFLSATKRWFVTSKPGAATSNQNAVIYTNESSELQTRKLGDLYFMFRHYNLAFQAYHQAKRDFNADSAWQYYAGALEMAAISAFMLGTANRKTYDYMEDAILCYLTTCKLQQFATRATLISMECLKTARLYGEAAQQLIRMTSEESDLRSALLLEQAAYCFLASQPPMYRKYAFHIVLAGTRFSLAGQRKHSYRCYRQANQVFQDRGWSLAEDHIQYTIAKQAYNIKKLDEASRSFAHLLRPGSLQSAQLLSSFLRKYIQTQNELLKRNPEIGLLPHALPQVIQDSIRVLLLGLPPIQNPLYVPASNIDIQANLSDEPIWHKIEEMIVATANSNKPFVFKPTRSLFTKENATAEYPIAVQGEPIELAVTVFNTVKCSITLTQIDLLWKMTLENEETLSNSCLYVDANASENTDKTAINAVIKTSCSQSLILEENAKKMLQFSLTPKIAGHLNIIGIVCQMAATAETTASLLGALHFEAQRIRSIGKQSTATLLDSKLSIKIIPIVPALSVSFTAVPTDMLVGEIVPVTISLRNSGLTPIEDIYIGCDNPRWITLLDKDADVPLSVISSIKDISNEKLVKEKEIRRQHVFRLLKNKKGAALNGQESTTVPMWLQAPYKKGEFKLRLLFYYGLQGATNPNMKYRLVRHCWNFKVHSCLGTDVTCVTSNTLTDELSLSVNVKNEIVPLSGIHAELHINALDLYCQEYKLNPNKFNHSCLKSAKSASFLCRLTKNNVNSNTTQVEALLSERLSSMEILPPTKLTSKPPNHLPPLKEFYGFLAKHETNFFRSSISSEEFNNTIATYDHHMTVALTWTAAVVQHAVQRIAYGQHFLKLRYLYENQSCPPTTNNRITPPNELEDLKVQNFKIEDFAKKKLTHNYENDYQTQNIESDEDYWETNNNYVGRRCLLEDDSFALTVKG